MLNSMLEKFKIGSQKLQLILNNQKAIFNKAGIGFNPLRRKKFVKNMFTKATHENHSIVYFKCNKVGHKILKYNIKKNDYTLIK